MSSFGEKSPTEQVVLTFNFAPRLDDGETLIGPVSVTITNLWGADNPPSLVQNAVPQIDQSTLRVYVPVMGGLDNNDYEIFVSCPTNNPYHTPDMRVTLPVRLYPRSADCECP